MYYYIYTLGCKVNQYESEAMAGMLADVGYLPAESAETADIVLINSCTVTATSDQKVRQLLHKIRRNRPDCLLILTGCMPQAFPEAAARFSEADIVLGNSSRASLLPAIDQFYSQGCRVVQIKPYNKDSHFEPLKVHNFHERTRAFLKIEDGCNRFCSYCIIPYARGRVRSKPLAELVEELNVLAQNGYREAVLVGINLSSYGQDTGLHLCDAVEAACAVDGIRRVRLGSLEPELLDEPAVERLAKQKKLCPQFHLSLQSGCDATLRRMNRHYDTAQYRKIVWNLRRHFENCAITTDMMVGFPGETEGEFQESLAFMEEIRFAKVHVFPYSRRPGTRAAEATGQLTSAVKEERSRLLAERAGVIRREFLLEQCGKQEEVLFETPVKNGEYTGYTRNYSPVRACFSNPPGADPIPVLITGVDGDDCIAVPIAQSDSEN
jgi:threonylcarbamoyladenosine tRNA methylthiotransferase MtaB